MTTTTVCDVCGRYVPTPDEAAAVTGTGMPDTWCADGYFKAIAARTTNWTPLVRALDHDEGRMGYFMFMGIVAAGSGQTIYLYKHKFTRRYLNCDLGGNCYRYDADGSYYRPWGRESAIDHAFS